VYVYSARRPTEAAFYDIFYTIRKQKDTILIRREKMFIGEKK
jgi:hypothetical protein